VQPPRLCVLRSRPRLHQHASSHPSRAANQLPPLHPRIPGVGPRACLRARASRTQSAAECLRISSTSEGHGAKKCSHCTKGAVCAYPNKRMRRRPARAKHAAVGPWRPINHDMTRTLTNPTPGIARTSLERLGVPPCCVGLPARLAKNRMAQTATGHGGPKLFVRSAPKLGGPGSLRSQQEQVLW
jgi:hypothetical protein